MSANPADETMVEYATEPTLAQSVIEQRNGYPGHVPESEGSGDSGLLRVGFREDEDLTEITWEEFREEFAEKGLVALYREDGEPVEGESPVVLRDADHVDGK